MRVMVATQGSGGLDDIVSPVFGRAPSFTIVEAEGSRIDLVEAFRNPYMGGFWGGGIQIAQMAASKGVKAVIAGSVGPNASSTLAQFGITAITGYSGLTVKEAVSQALRGGFPTGGVSSITVSTPPSFPSSYSPPLTGVDKDYEVKMLRLQKQMIEETIKYLEKKIKELSSQ